MKTNEFIENSPQGSSISEMIEPKNNSGVERTPLLEWWYKLTAPPDVPSTAPFAERETVRRGRYASFILLVAFLGVLSPLPVAIQSKNHALLPTILAVIALQCVTFVLNRRGRLLTAGIIVVIIAELGICSSIFSQGLSVENLALLDLLVQPEIFAVSLLPPIMVFPITALNAIFIFFCLFIVHHDPTLTHVIAQQGYGAFLRPIENQLIVALVSYLWVTSANIAIKRADRATTIAQLQSVVAEQQRELVQQRHLLNASIQQIEAVHEQVANGRLSARIPLTSDNMLWSIVGKLNNLLNRYQRAMEAENELERTKSAAFHLIQFLRQNKNKGQLPFINTGTVIDAVLLEFADRFPHSPDNYGQSSPPHHHF